MRTKYSTRRELEVAAGSDTTTFYRLLGLDMPDSATERPVSRLQTESGVSIVLAQGYAAANDPTWTRPTNGYQQFLEFFVGTDGAVDDLWDRLTTAGHHGRLKPRRTTGPYVGMVDDLDGNVIMITCDSNESTTD